MKIRIAQKTDAEQMLEIYIPFVRNNAVSFETEVPTVKEFAKRITNYMQTYPWLVFEHENKIIGYGYASKYRDRVAYQWSCECSVYVDTKYRREGIAKKLYSALFQILRFQGFVNVYAVITHPNPASVKFHETLGFKKFAVYKKVGYKLGKWHNVMWYEMKLNTHLTPPGKPKPFASISSGGTVRKILNKV